MRADRLAEASAYPAFARLLERSLYLLGAMTEDGLRAAVEAPARQSGLLIEPGLVDVLVSEVAGTAGALPLMSHALLETWKRREANTLTVEGYTASGGIRGAVAQSAEAVYAGIGPEQRLVLRDLVLRLVSSGMQGEPVRARLPRRLFSAEPDHQQLIDLWSAPAWSLATRGWSRSPTKRSPAPGRGYGPGWTRTWKASASVSTSPRPPTGGTRSDDLTASCTAACG